MNQLCWCTTSSRARISSRRRSCRFRLNTGTSFTHIPPNLSLVGLTKSRCACRGSSAYAFMNTMGIRMDGLEAKRTPRQSSMLNTLFNYADGRAAHRSEISETCFTLILLKGLKLAQTQHLQALVSAQRPLYIQTRQLAAGNRCSPACRSISSSSCGDRRYIAKKSARGSNSNRCPLIINFVSKSYGSRILWTDPRAADCVGAQGFRCTLCLYAWWGFTK